jgi:ABC-2 type transport system permease protein
MANVLKVAIKEFDSLMTNKFAIIIFIIYILIISFGVYDQFVDVLAGAVYSNFLGGLSFVLIYYGTAIAVVVGFCSISIEKKSNTLNTLITKPLYRDTIINGKLIGSALFMAFTSILASIIYFSETSMLMGNIINTGLSTFIFGVLFTVLVSWICQLIFLSISMLLSIFIRDDIFALFAGMFVYLFLINIISDTSFSQSLSYILGNSYLSEFIASLGPDNLSYNIINHANDLSNFSSYGFSVINLLLYLVIAVVLSYVVFIRRDIA